MAAGLNVAMGHDCVMDPWYGMGSGDMLEVAHMGLHVAQMTSQAGIRRCFEAVTTNAAKLMHLPRYGIEAGAGTSGETAARSFGIAAQQQLLGFAALSLRTAESAARYSASTSSCTRRQLAICPITAPPSSQCGFSVISNHRKRPP